MHLMGSLFKYKPDLFLSANTPCMGTPYKSLRNLESLQPF